MSKAAKNVRDACIYCGTQKDLTSDHVPPKALFAEPRPSHLITVPACRPCNKSYEKDDEYFRVAVLAQVASEQDPAAARLWSDKVIRGTLWRSPRLKRVIVQNLTAIDIVTPGGIYLGTTPTIRFARRRLDRVAQRMVTALHWHHYGHVPRDRVKFTIEMGPNPKQPGIAEKVARNVLGGRPWVAIGDGAFRYAYNRVADDPDWRAWLLQFFSGPFIVTLLTKDEEDPR
jgi:hypothetical protein